MQDALKAGIKSLDLPVDVNTALEHGLSNKLFLYKRV